MNVLELLRTEAGCQLEPWRSLAWEHAQKMTIGSLQLNSTLGVPVPRKTSPGTARKAKVPDGV